MTTEILMILVLATKTSFIEPSVAITFKKQQQDFVFPLKLFQCQMVQSSSVTFKMFHLPFKHSMFSTNKSGICKSKLKKKREEN